MRVQAWLLQDWLRVQDCSGVPVSCGSHRIESLYVRSFLWCDATRPVLQRLAFWVTRGRTMNLERILMILILAAAILAAVP